MSTASSYKKNERREQLSRGGLDIVRQLFWAVGLAVVAVGSRYGLYIANDQLGDTVPLFLSSSYFGILYVYTVLAFVGLTVHFMTHPSLFGFSELYNNRCHLLERMGLASSGVTTAKITATLFASAFVYTLGYGLTFLFGFIIRLNLVPNYLVSLYITGLTAIWMTVLLAMLLSILFRPGTVTVIVTLVAALLTAAALYLFGFFNYYDAEYLAVNVADMLKLGPVTYLAIFTYIGIVSCCVCVITATARAGSYNAKVFEPDSMSGDYSPDDVMAARSVPLMAAPGVRPVLNRPMQNTGVVNGAAAPKMAPQQHAVQPVFVAQPGLSGPQQHTVVGGPSARPQETAAAPQNGAFSFFNPTGAKPAPKQGQQAHGEEPQPQAEHHPAQQQAEDHDGAHNAQMQPPQAANPYGNPFAPQPGPGYAPQQPVFGQPQRQTPQYLPQPQQLPRQAEPQRDYSEKPLTGFGVDEKYAEEEIKVKTSVAKIIFCIIFALLGIGLAAFTLLGKSADMATETNEIIRFMNAFATDGTGFIVAIAASALLILVAVLLAVMSKGVSSKHDDDEDYDEDYDEDEDE